MTEVSLFTTFRFSLSCRCAVHNSFIFSIHYLTILTTDGSGPACPFYRCNLAILARSSSLQDPTLILLCIAFFPSESLPHISSLFIPNPQSTLPHTNSCAARSRELNFDTSPHLTHAFNPLLHCISAPPPSLLSPLASCRASLTCRPQNCQSLYTLRASEAHRDAPRGRFGIHLQTPAPSSWRARTPTRITDDDTTVHGRTKMYASLSTTKLQRSVRVDVQISSDFAGCKWSRFWRSPEAPSTRANSRPQRGSYGSAAAKAWPIPASPQPISGVHAGAMAWLSGSTSPGTSCSITHATLECSRCWRRRDQ